MNAGMGALIAVAFVKRRIGKLFPLE